MGINRLNTFLRQSIKVNWPRLVPLSQFKNKAVAVDIMITIYKFRYVALKIARDDGCLDVDMETMILSDSSDKQVGKIFATLILNFLSSFVKRKITPVIVFDGEPPQAKINCEKDRRNKNREKIKQAAIDRQQINLACCFTKTDLVSLTKDLCQSIGFPVLTAVDEGERLCAALCREGLVESVYTADSDVFAHGAPSQIHQRPGKVLFLEDGDLDVVEIYELDTILQHLGISMEQFQDTCILAGCDYNTHIKNIAFARAYKLILEHKNFSNLPTNIDTSCLNYQQCKELFSLKPAENLSLEPLTTLNMNKEINRFEQLDRWKDYDIASNIEFLWQCVDEL